MTALSIPYLPLSTLFYTWETAAKITEWVLAR